jgi:Na+/melibiose symporter-like transporter
MIPNSELLLNIMKLALTTAAMTIPAISVAYFLITRSYEERTRMSKIIGYGSISAIILVICALFTFFVLCLGFENEPVAMWISGGSFALGCVLLLYILLVLAGFKLKREIPMPRPEPQQQEQ